MSELSIEQQNLWERKAKEHVTHNAGDACQPFAVALLDAIQTIRAQHAQIAGLLSRLGEPEH